MTRTSQQLGTGSDRIAAIRARLSDQAELFDDPAAYRAGVDDALRAVVEADMTPLSVLPFTLLAHADSGRSERARYIAALAVALASSTRSRRRVLDDLIEAADHDPALLEESSRVVAGLRVGDVDQRHHAEGLLVSAAIDRDPTRHVGRTPEVG